MKKHILNSVIVICLSFFVVFIAIGSVQSKPYTYKLDGVYSISPDGILSLISEDAEIVIKGSDRTDVHIVVRKEYNISGLFVAHENEPFEMDIEEDDGNIIMREVGGIFNTVGIMTIMREEYEISIDIPTGVSLKLRGEDDNYLIENVNGNISLRIEDGRARLKQCNGEQFNIEIEDGNVEMDSGSGMLDVFIEDGKLTVENGKFSDIDASCEDGTLDIETSLSSEGVYRLNAEDGRIYFNVTSGGGEFQVRMDDGHVRASSKFELLEEDDDNALYRLPGGSAKIRARVEDGSIRIHAD